MTWLPFVDRDVRDLVRDGLDGPIGAPGSGSREEASVVTSMLRLEATTVMDGRLLAAVLLLVPMGGFVTGTGIQSAGGDPDLGPPLVRVGLALVLLMGGLGLLALRSSRLVHVAMLRWAELAGRLDPATRWRRAAVRDPVWVVVVPAVLLAIAVPAWFLTVSATVSGELALVPFFVVVAVLTTVTGVSTCRGALASARVLREPDVEDDEHWSR